VVSDTPRWGEALGFPRYQVSEQLLDDGSVRVIGNVTLAGLRLEWEEPPANWIAPHWFEQYRLFTRGPIRGMTLAASIEERGEHSGLEMTLSFETANPLGSLLAKRLVAAFEDKVRSLLDTAERLLAAERPELFASNYRPPPAALRRGQQLAGEIAASPYGHGLAERLLEYVNEGQEVDLWSMRPLALARRWRADPRATVELFLQAVRAGMLESRWDILCPRCRISKSKVSNIAELPSGVHCDACNIDFETEFASNVELSFSPSPAVRPIGGGFYCRSGPGVTPHIKGQCVLPAGESRSLPLTLEPGDYRLRTLEAGPETSFSWDGGSFPAIRLDDSGIELDGDSPTGEIAMRNASERARTLVIEDQNWLRDVLTAEQVTTLQVFRDLFSEQVLRPGDEVSIRNISFAFTDLADSADLFSRLGDAAAYRLVRELFALMADIVRRHRGNIVKTVGDGVHAAFAAPDDALHAALEMQDSIAEFNRRFDSADIGIRVGLHSGSSIAVTLNGRLDYYGEAVNLAARLEGEAEAGGIAMSLNFTRDQAVGDILQGYRISSREAQLKGFHEPVTICRINPQASHE
jgi:class 3 adenylate cyclase